MNTSFAHTHTNMHSARRRLISNIVSFIFHASRGISCSTDEQKKFVNKEFHVVVVVVKEKFIYYPRSEKRQNMFCSLNALRHFHTPYKRITISQKHHATLPLENSRLTSLCVRGSVYVNERTLANEAFTFEWRLFTNCM